MVRNVVFISLLVFFALANNIWAQENVNQEVKVIKPYEPVINDAFKISELPKIVDTNKVITKFEYEIVTAQHETGFKPRPIKPARLVSEPLSKLYYGHLKAGFGSYLSPLAEAYVGSKRSKKLNWHVNLHHNSSHGKIKNEASEKVYAGLSDSRANAQLNYFAKKSKVLSLSTQFNNNSNYYYGYNPDAIVAGVEAPLVKDSIENQVVNFFKIKANWRTNYLDSANVNYNVNLGYQTLAAKNGVSENALKVETNLNYFFEKEFIGADLALNYYSNSGIEDTINGAIVKFSPWIGAFGNKWRTVVGVSTFYDQVNENYHFYPRISMHYNIIDYFLIPYLEVDGKYSENSYHAIYKENPFVKQTLGVKPTNTKMNVTFGFRGNVSSKVAFNAKLNYAKINNQYFFVNELTGLQNKFDVVYDNLSRIRILGEVSYKTGEELFLTFKANYYKYTLDSLSQPWHMPNYKLSLNARYILQKKIILEANVFGIGDRYAREINNGLESDKLLEGSVDLNLGVEYKLSKVFSAFVQFNNISAVKYYNWNHYPSQQFNVMIGVTYTL